MMLPEPCWPATKIMSVPRMNANITIVTMNNAVSFLTKSALAPLGQAMTTLLNESKIPQLDESVSCLFKYSLFGRTKHGKQAFRPLQLIRHESVPRQPSQQSFH